MADIFGTPGPDVLDATAGDGGGVSSETLDGTSSEELVATDAPTLGLIDLPSFQDFIGGPGDDTFISNFGVADNFDGGGGVDTVDYRTYGNGINVYLSVDEIEFGSGPNGDRLIRIENLITGNGSDFIRGSPGNNRIETNGGNDFLWGYGGSDTLLGGIGDDTYYGVESDDTVVEAANEGIDLIRLDAVGASFTLPDNVENLMNETGTGADLIGNVLGNELSGGSGNDRIYGLAGNDILDGLSGYDELYGGPGDDLYILRRGYDDTSLIVELANEGIDRVAVILPSYILPDNVENLTGGAYAIGATIYGNTLTGNALANAILGSEAADTIYGLDGDDVLSGNSGNDTLYGGNGNDTLNGGQGFNTLYGEAGDDVLLVVAAPAQGLIDGGEGFDTFRTNVGISATAVLSGIEQVEFISGIIDLTLNSQQVSGLAANTNFIGTTGLGRIVINMSAAGALSTSAYTFGGNIALFRINGSSGDDVIIGPANFASELNGGGGADTLYGGAQEDTITGGTGADTYYGGGGSDRLNAEVGDALVDGGAGFDTLAYSASGTVTGTLANLEYFLLLSGASVSLSAAQLVAGFGSAGTFSGTGAVSVNMAPGDGTLSLSGYTIVPGFTVAVTVNGSTANDQIKGLTGSVNTINGGDGNDQIRGGIFTDTIGGGAGNDKIFGAGGADILTGGAGADQFRYLFADDSRPGTAADRITDFLSGTDRLNFALLDADPVAAGRQALTYISTAAFSATGTAQVRYGVSGADLLVQVDLDGNGTADMEMVLVGAGTQVLTGGDFML